MGEQPRRVIAHLDADAFYASVHLLEDPSLAGKPVIVAGTGPRSIVTTASYEARRYGIGSAQPAARARALCPHGVFLEPQFELYRAYSARAMQIIHQVTDVVEPLSLDEAYLDITGIERPIATMRELVQTLRRETGLTYSVGIGPNKLCAKVLSDYRKPRAFNVASREQCCELFADAAPRLINGIGPKTADALDALGLTTIAQLRSAPYDQLARRFGERRARELQARARFEHDGAVQADRERKSISEERTYHEDIDDPQELTERLRQLALELADRLAERDLRGRTIGIKLRYADFTTYTRAQTQPTRTNDPDTLVRVTRELLERFDPTAPVRLLGVSVARFDEDDDAALDPGRAQQLRLPVDVPLA